VMEKKYSQALTAAKSQDAQEDTPELAESSTWADARV